MEYITYKMIEISKLNSGGDRPKIYSDTKTNECCFPIFSNGLQDEGLYGYTNKATMPSDTITVSARGANIGEVFYRKEDFLPIVRLITIIPDSNYVHSKYLYYYLKKVKIEGSGSAQPQITVPFFSRYKIVIPKDVEYQKKVAYILSAYDNLIENNNKRIKLLEQMAENLYKEWFVRFRFPGYEDVEFIDGFPKEWKICRIDQLSKIKAGGDAPDDSTKEITDECSIPIYSNGIENEGLYGYTSKAKINKPSISISARGTVGYTCLRRVSYTPIVRLICIIPHEEKLANWLFYYFKRTIVIANGTSQQQITIPMMSREKVLLPTNDLIQKFYEYSTCCLDEIDSLKAQNSNLKKQRDMLLPRLMSGKLEV